MNGMRVRNIILGVAVSFGLAACSTPEKMPPPPPASDVAPLRVGVTPYHPPLIFNQQGEIAGLEVDLMRRVGRELARPVRVVVLPWDELVDALMAGNVDVIMSGMSITESRRVRIAFTAMMRQRDAGNVQSAGDIAAFRGRIGVLPGTTGHDFVRRSCPDARLIRIATAGDAAVQLQRNVIDMFIHDIPSVLWQVSAHEAELAAVMERLSHEQIAWGVRREDQGLLNDLNRMLRAWTSDGSLDADILRWIPYYDSIR